MIDVCYFECFCSESFRFGADFSFQDLVRPQVRTQMALNWREDDGLEGAVASNNTLTAESTEVPLETTVERLAYCGSIRALSILSESKLVVSYGSQLKYFTNNGDELWSLASTCYFGCSKTWLGKCDFHKLYKLLPPISAVCGLSSFKSSLDTPSSRK